MLNFVLKAVAIFCLVQASLALFKVNRALYSGDPRQVCRAVGCR